MLELEECRREERNVCVVFSEIGRHVVDTAEAGARPPPIQGEQCGEPPLHLEPLQVGPRGDVALARELSEAQQQAGGCLLSGLEVAVLAEPDDPQRPEKQDTIGRVLAAPGLPDLGHEHAETRGEVSPCCGVNQPLVDWGRSGAGAELEPRAAPEYLSRELAKRFRQGAVVGAQQIHEVPEQPTLERIPLLSATLLHERFGEQILRKGRPGVRGQHAARKCTMLIPAIRRECGGCGLGGRHCGCGAAQQFVSWRRRADRCEVAEICKFLEAPLRVAISLGGWQRVGEDIPDDDEGALMDSMEEREFCYQPVNLKPA
ncbi:hypothetical protein AUL38_14630 [Leucobacter sp. G161]|nr:hypothetical protein AUL38_14630 [Leucobacter sp. G161]